MIVLSKTRIVIMFILTFIFACAGIGTVIAGRQGGWSLVLFAAATAIVTIVLLPISRPQTDELPARIAQFPKPITLTVHRGRGLLLTLASSMVALALFFGLSSSGGFLGSVVFYTASSLVFGAMGLMLLAATTKPNRLTVDAEGLSFENIICTRRWGWHDVQDFRAVSAVMHGKRIIKVTGIIGFDDRKAMNTSRARRRKKRMGVSTTIPNHFGASDDELASALNAWRLRAISEGL